MSNASGILSRHWRQQSSFAKFRSRSDCNPGLSEAKGRFGMCQSRKTVVIAPQHVFSICGFVSLAFYTQQHLDVCFAYLYELCIILDSFGSVSVSDILSCFALWGIVH